MITISPFVGIRHHLNYTGKFILDTAFPKFDFHGDEMIIYEVVRKLSREQRSVVAEKIMDWGNLVFTGLVLAQFVPGIASFQWHFFFAGLMGIMIAYISGILLMKR